MMSGVCLIAFTGISYGSHGLAQQISKPQSESCYIQDSPVPEEFENFYGFYDDSYFPVQELQRMHRFVHRMLHTNDNQSIARIMCPDIDIIEQENAFVVKCDLPGIKKEDIDIRLDRPWLIIECDRTYTKQNEENKPDGRYYVRERGYGAFRRTVHVPETVRYDDITAKYENGVLTITLPSEKDRAKDNKDRIEVL
jgi:HSP20 family protein